MLKNDKWIIKKGEGGMITPFVDTLINSEENRKVISYGVSSFGYDIRLSSKEFKVFRNVSNTVTNPKNFKPELLANAPLFTNAFGKFFILPANSYGLGVSLERIKMPTNVTALCVGKSTYARCGVIANVTPLEAGWEGYITLEFSNSSSQDCKIFAEEGVVQLLFFEGEHCNVTYADRKGKYHSQSENVTFAR